MTTSRFESLVRRLVLVLGLGAGLAAGLVAGVGCGGQPEAPVSPPVTSPTTAQLQVDVQDHLARLRDLQVVEVGQLVMQLPDEATACYGLPCSPEAAESLDRALRVQAPRLARLTDLAEQSAQTPTVTGDPGDAAADLAALRGLAIVELGGLLSVTPQKSASCYNLVCPGDAERAAAENARRAHVLHDVATAAVARGL
ncbi:MAG: hypothetical protein QOI66_1249 [Myxococcales bacterium]|jgi:hypothetical protein|nr:hypothetical protein [Myxococcales bacterium]